MKYFIVLLLIINLIGSKVYANTSVEFNINICDKTYMLDLNNLFDKFPLLSNLHNFINGEPSINDPHVVCSILAIHKDRLKMFVRLMQCLTQHEQWELLMQLNLTETIQKVCKAYDDFKETYYDPTDITCSKRLDPDIEFSGCEMV